VNLRPTGVRDCCSENRPILSHCEGPQPRSNLRRRPEIALLRPSQPGYRPPRNDIFMRRGAAPGMKNCPENRTRMNADKRGKRKPSALVRACLRPILTRRGAVPSMDICSEPSERMLRGSTP